MIESKTVILKQKRTHHKDRFTINKENLVKVEVWFNQFLKQYPGVKVKRLDIVDDLISQAPAEPTKVDLSRLHKKFFDEVKHLEWLLKEAKLAKSGGGEFDLSAHLKRNSPGKLKRKPKRKKGQEPLGLDRKLDAKSNPPSRENPTKLTN